MIKSIAMYIEGGGDIAKTNIPFRKGMLEFLKPVANLARKKSIRWDITVCGGRREAYDAFVNAIKKYPERCNLLLVDSEEAVSDETAPWVHLLNRKGDGWKRPEGASDEQCQLMVISMEAWFLADPDNLVKHFGSHFDASKLPPADRAEITSKDAINEALKKATKNTAAKEYRKIRDGAKLLEKIDPNVVRKHCKWCERLFSTLEKLVS